VTQNIVISVTDVDDTTPTIVGNNNANTLNGNGADNHIAGLGGDDRLAALAHEVVPLVPSAPARVAVVVRVRHRPDHGERELRDGRGHGRGSREAPGYEKDEKDASGCRPVAFEHLLRCVGARRRRP